MMCSIMCEIINTGRVNNIKDGDQNFWSLENQKHNRMLIQENWEEIMLNAMKVKQAMFASYRALFHIGT